METIVGDNEQSGNARSLAEELSAEIEQRLLHFEQTWGTSNAQRLEELLDEVSSENRPQLLRELLYIEFEFLQRRGDDFAVESYVSRFADHEVIVREVAQSVREYTTTRHKKIEGYTLLDELGRGGMGVVYRAKSDLLNTFVAFKMVNRSMLENPDLRKRFTRELEMIGRLKHPNIVEAKHAGIAEDGSPFLVMELIEGVTLSQWSQQNPPPKTHFSPPPSSTVTNVSENVSELDSAALEYFYQPIRPDKQRERTRIRTACVIIRDVALGLQAIHEAGLVHRDIKPSNIMLLGDGRVKILDLGLAKLRECLSDKSIAHSAHTRQGHLLGTPGYIAPEQMHSAADVDIRADIYSLGCTFFFLLCGRAPTEMRPQELTAKLSPRLHAILNKALAADPAARYREPQEVVTAIDNFLGASRRRQKSLIVTGVVALVVIATFFGVAFFSSSPSVPPNSPPQNNKTILDTPEVSETTLANAQAVLPVAAPPNISATAIEIPTAQQILAAIDLRYQGNWEHSLALLRKMENDLRAAALNNDLRVARDNNLRAERDDLSPRLIDVLIAQGDALFFLGLAADALPDKAVKRMVAWYEEALALSADSSDKTTQNARIEWHCKLAIAAMIHPTENNVIAKRLRAARQLLREQEEPNANEDSSLSTLCLQLTEAIVRLVDSDEQPLRRFVEQFELSPAHEWFTREATDLRLFALEQLITQHAKTQAEKLPQDLRSLDAILLTPYPDQFSSAYWNRFYDLAIRYSDPHDYAQLVKYLCRLRPLGTQGTRTKLPAGATLVLLYFSPANEFDGFAIYYPSSPQEPQRFELPYNRNRICEAIKQGELLTLDAELVTRIRSDMAANLPIVLSWDDACCWSLRRDAVTNEDWPFDKSITIEEMLGKLK